MKKRYTKYHAGVAVIDGKENLSEAMAKLAKYEDLEQDEPHMQEMADELAEYVCTQICGNPKGSEKCKECRVGALIERMEQFYNTLNLHVGSELERLVKENCTLEKKNVLLKQNVESLLKSDARCSVDLKYFEKELVAFVEENIANKRLDMNLRRNWPYGALIFATGVGLISPRASNEIRKKYFHPEEE